MSGANKLIPFAVAVFVGAAVFIMTLNDRPAGTTSGEATASGIPPGVGPKRPKTGDASGDTTTETLQTISAQFNQATQQFTGDLTDTRATVDQLKQQLETLAREANTRNGEGLAAQVRQRVQVEVQRALGRLDRFNRTSPEGRETVGVQPPIDYPITDQSLGFAPGTLEGPVNTLTQPNPIPAGYIAHPRGDNRYLQVVSLYQTAPPGDAVPYDSNALERDAGINLLDANAPTARTHSDPELGPADTTPYATLPAGSTLFDATAFTALIGRIPVGGQVVDPMPIKVLIGSDNLAANGHRIHGLRGMVLSGSAIGDATLRCVKANLHAATFVFDDGSIATVGTRRSRNRASSQTDFGTAQGRLTTDGAALGWISDEQGNPCIPGELITDAPQRITALTLAGGLAGAAEAYAEQQITQSVAGGAITRSVTGSNTDFLIGSTASQGLNAALQDLKSRFQDRFDAIYIEAGHAIVVHIDQTLPIDHNPANRRLNYPMTATRVSHELD